MRQRVFRTREAALYVGLRPSTLEKLRVRGNGPKFVRLGRAVGYLIDDVDAWLEARKVASTSELAQSGDA